MVPLKKKKKKKLVRSFLEKETSPVEISQDHIQVDLEIIKKSFKEFKVVSDVLSEDSPSPVSESSWKWWCCCYCNHNFPDSATHGKHIFMQHLEPLPEGLSVFLRRFRKAFPDEWSKKIYESCWTPINVATDALFTEGCWTPFTDWDVSLMSTDTERAKLLESIGASFKTLLEKKVLHITHLYTILNYAMRVVEGLPSGNLLKIKGVDKNSTLCFRCLGVPQLEHVRDFLSKIELWSEEKSPSDDDNVFLAPQDDTFLAPPDNNMRVVLDRSRSSIHIYADGWFIQSDSSHGNASWKVNAEAVVSWLYSGSRAEDALMSWIKSEDVREDLGPRILKKYATESKKLSVLQGLYKYCVNYKDALLKIGAKCEDERKGRAEAEHAIQSFKAVLEGWKESLAELSEEESKVRMKAINQVLKGAEDIIKASGNRDDKYKFDTPNVCDKIKEDNTIRKALAKEKTELNLQFLRITAQIMKSVAASQRLEERLENVLCFDYLTLVIPLVKSVLRKKWESDVISEAFLKEYEQTQENCNSKLSKGQKETRWNCTKLEKADANLSKPGPNSNESYLKEYKLSIDVKELKRRLMERIEYQKQLQEEEMALLPQENVLAEP